MLRSLALFLVAGVLTLAPLSAFAATVNFFGPIIPDGTNGQPDCNCDAVVGPDGSMYPSAPDWGCVLQTVQNAIAVGVSFVVVIITLSIAYAGIMIMANPNNPGQREQGRSLVMNAIIGLVIVLTAWLMVDFVMKAFYNPSAAAPYIKGDNFAWNAIISDDSGGKYCFSPTATPKPTSTGDGGGALNPVPAGAGGGTTPPSSTGPTTPSTPAPQDPTTTAAPSAPTSFNISYSGTTATVLWKKATSGVTTYTIERWKDGDTSWTQLATVKVANAGTYEDKNLQAGTKYTYRMFAWNGTKNSPSTEMLSITTSGGSQTTTGTVPASPVSLTAALSGTTKVTLSWSAVTGATAYQIDVATVAAGSVAPTDSKAWTGINPSSGTSYTYSIPTASQTNSSLYFRLWAKNGSVYSKAPATNSVTLRSGSTAGGGSSSGGSTTCPEPTVKTGSAIVSQTAISKLKTILKNACLSSATITSGYRDPENQARVMYDNLEQRGVTAEKVLYGTNGDKVIDVYSEQKAAGKTATQIKSAMEAKIWELGPGNVSDHSDQAHNTFDVDPNSISDEAKFKTAIMNAKSTGLIIDYKWPPKDEAFHIVGTQPI